MGNEIISHCFCRYDLKEEIPNRQEDGSRCAEESYDETVGKSPGNMGNAEGIQQVEKDASANDVSNYFFHRMNKEEKGNQDNDDTGDAIASEGS